MHLEERKTAAGSKRQRIYHERSLILGKILTCVAFAAIGSAFSAFYLWQDRPDAGDAGRHTLSGWLVDTFGAQYARPAGVAIFAILTLLLVAVLVLQLRRIRRLARTS